MTDSKQRHFIPAAPGFWALQALRPRESGTKDYEAQRIPVVGWELLPLDDKNPDLGFYARPVTTESRLSLTYGLPVLGPDGKVRVSADEICEDEEMWLTHVAVLDDLAAGVRRKA
jgi:hypothetical protein